MLYTVKSIIPPMQLGLCELLVLLKIVNVLINPREFAKALMSVLGSVGVLIWEQPLLNPAVEERCVKTS